MNPLRIRVKMCGMTRLDDVLEAVRLGVDAIGFIFYPKSPRYVSKETVKELLKALPPFVEVVGVFVNPDKQFVEERIDELPIHLLQFHGDESPQFCEQFHRSYIKAIAPRHGEEIHQSMQYYQKAQALLLDTPSDAARGGTGLSFDWNLIPLNLAKPFILAGGLNEGNILAAVNRAKPFAVDVCSGIEQKPGIKDHQKMKGFLNALWGKQ